MSVYCIPLFISVVMFFPYDARKLRCHPNAAAITSEYSSELTLGSMKRVTYKCAQCGSSLNTRVDLLCYQTMLCKNHNKKTYGRRERYNGVIAKEATIAIRAGLLLLVDQEKLIDVIASFDTMSTETDPRSVAMKYIAELAEYSSVQLADNCFWGNDSAFRVTKERYKRSTKKQKMDAYDELPSNIESSKVFISVINYCYTIFSLDC